MTLADVSTNVLDTRTIAPNFNAQVGRLLFDIGANVISNYAINKIGDAIPQTQSPTNYRKRQSKDGANVANQYNDRKRFRRKPYASYSRRKRRRNFGRFRKR